MEGAFPGSSRNAHLAPEPPGSIARWRQAQP